MSWATMRERTVGAPRPAWSASRAGLTLLRQASVRLPRAAGCGRRARPRRCPCFGWPVRAQPSALARLVAPSTRARFTRLSWRPFRVGGFRALWVSLPPEKIARTLSKTSDIRAKHAHLPLPPMLCALLLDTNEVQPRRMPAAFVVPLAPGTPATLLQLTDPAQRPAQPYELSIWTPGPCHSFAILAPLQSPPSPPRRGARPQRAPPKSSAWLWTTPHPPDARSPVCLLERISFPPVLQLSVSAGWLPCKSETEASEA